MKKQKGFTLIELLVVIAIIGILAAVVLASLNAARKKGGDSAVKSQLANMRAQAEVYYNNQASLVYTGVCTSATGILTMVNGAIKTGGIGVTCNDSSSAWATGVQLPTSGTYWCVDSVGVSRGKTASGAIYTAVSGSATAALTTATSTSCN